MPIVESNCVAFCVACGITASAALFFPIQKKSDVVARAEVDARVIASLRSEKN